MGGQSSKAAASGGEEADGEGRKRRREDEDTPHKSPTTTAKKGRQRHPKKKARPAESQPPPAVQRTFKVCLAPDDVRRFTIPLGLWSEFEALLRSQYPWAFDHTEGWVVAIRYEDESGDLCILSSQPEWDALCHNPLLGRIVRVFINHETPRVIAGLHTIKAEKMEEADDETAESGRVKNEDEPESIHYGARSAENENEGEKTVYSSDQHERLLLPREEPDGLADFRADLCDLSPSAPVGLDVEAWPTEDSGYGSMLVFEADAPGWTTTTTTTATASVVESEESEREQDDRDQHDGAYDEDGNYYERLRRQREEAEGRTQTSESTEVLPVPTIVVEQAGGDDMNEGGQEDQVTTDEREQAFFPSSPLQVDASDFPAARKKNGRRRLRRSSSK